MRRSLVPVATLALLVSIPALGAATAPYPPSDLIEGVSWDFENALRDAAGSDLWPVTWADDGKVYTAWGDGSGFTMGPVGSKVSYGFAVLTGTPPSYTGTDVSGFEPPDGKGKVSTLLSAAGVLYMSFLEQDGGHDYSMAYSTDHGESFRECGSAMWPDTGTFFPSGFVNFGRDNAGARDGYLYLYGTRWIWTQGAADNLYLARVPAPSPSAPESICDIGAFEYLSGPDEDSDGVFDGGAPTWSADIARRVAVFRDPNGVANTGMATAVHNPELGRYILTVSHRPEGEDLVAGVGQLGLFEGPEPWGPWRTVAYEDDWGSYGNGESLGYHIATKWFSGGGTVFWMTFSSTGDLDSFNLIQGTFTLSGAENRPPAAAASARPTSGSAPLAVQLSSEGSGDPDGTITAYHWDLGDGAQSSEADPAHTYQEAGSYTAVLTVTDDDGATDTDTVLIEVSPGPGEPPSEVSNLHRTDT